MPEIVQILPVDKDLCTGRDGDNPQKQYVKHAWWKDLLNEFERIINLEFRVTSFIRDVDQHREGFSLDVSVSLDKRVGLFKERKLLSAVYFYQPILLFNLLKLQAYKIIFQKWVMPASGYDFLYLVIGIECDHIHMMITSTNVAELSNRVIIQPWVVNDKYPEITEQVVFTLNTFGFVNSVLNSKY